MKTMWIVMLVATIGAGVAGCGTKKLQYLPEPVVTEARLLSADYTELDTRRLVEVQTDGYRIDQVWIERADGTQVKPAQIEYEKGGGGGVGFGVGVGTGGRGIGTGVGVGTRTGGRGENLQRVKLYFDSAAVGDAPWTMRIKLMGLMQTTIVLPARDG